MSGASPYSDHVVGSALAVFKLPGSEYTHAALSAAYRRVALRCHPDKGGSQELFDTVRECYRVLHEHARFTGMWEDARALTDAYESTVDGRRSEERRLAPASGAAFNAAEFNSAFEAGRTRVEERDAGYSDWLARAAAEFEEREAPVINPERATAASFNRAFERHTPALDPQSGAVVIRPDYVSAGGIRGSLFDETEEVSDYTVDVGGGVTGADCRLAHANQRLSSASWARDEVRVDRATVRRLAVERSGGIGGAADASLHPREALSSRIDAAVSELVQGVASAAGRARY